MVVKEERARGLLRDEARHEMEPPVLLGAKCQIGDPPDEGDVQGTENQDGERDRQLQACAEGPGDRHGAGIISGWRRPSAPEPRSRR